MGRGRSAKGLRLWHPLEDRKPRWDDGPIRAARREDRDAGMEARRIVERARVDRVGIVLANDAPEHEAPANRAEIPHGVAAARGFRDGLSRGPREAQGA